MKHRLPLSLAFSAALLGACQQTEPPAAAAETTAAYDLVCRDGGPEGPVVFRDVTGPLRVGSNNMGPLQDGQIDAAGIAPHDRQTFLLGHHVYVAADHTINLHREWAVSGSFRSIIRPAGAVCVLSRR
jgi:hypothetical protein